LARPNPRYGNGNGNGGDSTTTTPSPPSIGGGQNIGGGGQISPTYQTTTNGGSSAGGGFGHQGFKMLIPPTIAFTPTVKNIQYEASVRELGQELADKLASTTYITPEELKWRFPDTQADIQAEINNLDRIMSAQRLEKVRALPPAETTYTQNGITFNCVGTKCEVISQPTTTPTSSIKSILPFVIIGILALVVIIILRARA